MRLAVCRNHSLQPSRSVLPQTIPSSSIGNTIHTTSSDHKFDNYSKSTAARLSKLSAKRELLSATHVSKTLASTSLKPSYTSQLNTQLNLLWGSIGMNWIHLNSPNFPLGSRRLCLPALPSGKFYVSFSTFTNVLWTTQANYLTIGGIIYYFSWIHFCFRAIGI